MNTSLTGADESCPGRVIEASETREGFRDVSGANMLIPDIERYMNTNKIEDRNIYLRTVPGDSGYCQNHQKTTSLRLTREEKLGITVRGSCHHDTLHLLRLNSLP